MVRKVSEPLSTIPDPCVVRDAMGKRLRELRLLRRLLRLSNDAKTEWHDTTEHRSEVKRGE